MAILGRNTGSYSALIFMFFGIDDIFPGLVFIPGFDGRRVVHITVDSGRLEGHGAAVDRILRQMLFPAEFIQRCLVVYGVMSAQSDRLFIFILRYR